MNGHLLLSGAQRERVGDALRVAFTPQRLAELLEYRLNKRLDDIALGGDYREIMFKVVRESQREGWTAALLLAAREALPYNTILFDLAGELSLAVSLPPRGELERMLAVGERFMDIGSFLERLTVLEGAVCRVEVGPDGRSGLGTGFRITAELAMTCAHVLDPVLAGEIHPNDVVFRFGYRRNRDGRVLHTGAEYRLAPDWFVDGSTPSDLDHAVPALDYAVVRLTSPQTDAADGLLSQPDDELPTIALHPSPVRPYEGRIICILQHPAGDPLKLAFGPVTGISEEGTHILHGVNTLGGSSGSPCFDARLRLVGIHQRGHDGDGKSNAAVSMGAIVQRLQQVNANVFTSV